MKGTPMEFIAQIQLADARPLDSAGVLPAQGLLSFFYDEAAVQVRQENLQFVEKEEAARAEAV